MKNTISELKNTEGIKSRLHEARIRSASWRAKKKRTPRKSKKRKRGSEKMKSG